MEWMLGIITALLVDIVLILTGQVWLVWWVVAAVVLWLVYSIVRNHREETRAARDAKRTARQVAKPAIAYEEIPRDDFRSFMGMN